MKTHSWLGENMKKLVEVQDVEGEGLVGLLGERVTLFCAIYIYSFGNPFKD